MNSLIHYYARSTELALLRGNARVSAGGDCGTMEAIIPQIRPTGIPLDGYRRMFPGVNLVEDTVLLPPKPLKGRPADLAAILVRRLAAGDGEMTNRSLYAELGVSKQYFGVLIRKPEWQAFIAQLGLNPQPLKGRAIGLRKLA